MLNSRFNETRWLWRQTVQGVQTAIVVPVKTSAQK
jgi:hypothetical protein